MDPLDVIAVSLIILVVLGLFHLLLKVTVWVFPPLNSGPSPVLPHHVTVRSVDSPEKEKAPIPCDKTAGDEQKPLGRQGSRYTYERLAMGKIKITTCDPLGRYIAVQNTSRLHPIEIGNWQLCRKIDQSIEIVFIFPENYVLRALGVCKVYTTDCKQEMSKNDLLFERRNWGSGSTIETSLIRPDGVTMAVFSETSESSGLTGTIAESNDA